MLQHVASRTITATQQVYTFNDVPLGAAAADRYIIVSASGARGNNTLTVSNITVAGEATTEVVAANQTVACCAIRRTSAPLAAGETGQIIVTFSNANGSTGCHLDVWSAKRLASPAAYDTKTGITTSANTVTAALDIPPRGAALAAAFGLRAANNDWRGSAASDSFPGGAAARSVTPAHGAAGFDWTGLTEDSDAPIYNGATSNNWVLLAAASFQFLPNERAFGAVMG